VQIGGLQKLTLIDFPGPVRNLPLSNLAAHAAE